MSGTMQKTYEPRFILPDYMVSMRLKEIEETMASDNQSKTLLNDERLECEEHLLFQERLREAHRRTGALSAVAFLLHAFMIDSDHEYVLDANDFKKPLKNLKNDTGVRRIPAQPYQIIGNMMNAVDKEYVDCSEVRRTDKLMDLAGNIVKPEFDAASKHVHDNALSVYQYYREVHSRDSLNDKHLKLVSSIHFGQQYANAFWTPLDLQMVYGDGNSRFMTNITQSVDIAAHEMTHAITDQECWLEYHGESGALSESIADVFGMMVKQWKLKQSVSQSDWLLGEGTVPQWGRALRSFSSEPANKFDIQPKTYFGLEQWKSKNAEALDSDYGGVHLLSGIPNYAFYRFCNSFNGDDFRAYDGLPAKIWYAVVVGHKLKPDSTFHEFAALTVEKAKELGGDEVARKLQQSWADAGVSTNKSESCSRATFTHA